MEKQVGSRFLPKYHINLFVILGNGSYHPIHAGAAKAQNHLSLANRVERLRKSQYFQKKLYILLLLQT